MNLAVDVLSLQLCERPSGAPGGCDPASRDDVWTDQLLGPPDMEYVAFETSGDEVFVCTRRAARNMSYQGMTKENGKVDVLATLTGQVCCGWAVLCCCEPFFKNLKLLKIQDILTLQTLKLYHKFRNNKLPYYIQNWPLFQNSNIHNHNTRGANALHKNRCSHVFAQKSLKLNITNIVNGTPDIILD